MAKAQTKYVFVTGGVLSGLGKGITAASLGKALKSRGYKVNIQKCDPYLNVDAGTLNPAEHGECFVTFDGAETDLDLGHYERFLDQELTRESSLMSGRIMQTVISDERKGKYLGKTVQIIPHVTEAIQDHIIKSSAGYDIQIVEIGGTVGDYEGLSFVEAIREMQYKVGQENCLYVHVVYMPYLETSKEFKTKPAQNAVRQLRALGILPDVLVVRSEKEAKLSNLIEKIGIFTGVPASGVALMPNAKTVYEVPLVLEKSGIVDYVCDGLEIKRGKSDLAAWTKMVDRAKDDTLPEVEIAVVAKYMDNEDTYMSVFEALRAAGWSHKYRLNISWIDAEKLTKRNVSKTLSKYHGIVVPGGFGTRGIEGKVIAADYAMESRIPYLGLCLGMQVATIAASRHCVDESATTMEIDKNAEYPVIHLMEDQKYIKALGGSMRLGDYPCVLSPNTLAKKLYKTTEIVERHRHRYEFNNQYRQILEDYGLVASGLSPDGQLVEIVEIPEHPFFIASQFHPEFRSRPDKPHPLFKGFIDASIKHVKIYSHEGK